MADTARPYLDRGEVKFTRFRCAGALRNRGFGCSRTDERYAASVSRSDWISLCRRIVRIQSLRDSTHSGWERRRSVRSCTSFRLLREDFHQDFCRPRMPAGKCFRGCRGVIRPASYGLRPHTPSLLCTAAWRKSCSGVSVMSTRAVSSKMMCLLANVWTLFEYLRNQLQL